MEEHTISLLHATRGRPEQAIRARSCWLEAAEFPERVEHIFAFDGDDTASKNVLSSFQHQVVDNPDKGCVAAWNLAARSSKGQILVQLSDDWLPIRHWDTKIAARIRSISVPAVLRVSDGHRTDDLIAFAVFNRAYLQLLGGDFLGPEYFGVYSDDEFSFRAYQNGVVIDARDIVFEHCHPSFTHAGTYDATYRRQNEIKRFVEGKQIFLARNPSARGHWLHEGSEQRYYLPPGHFYAQNILGPSILQPSPLNRKLPSPDELTPGFSYQTGCRFAPTFRKSSKISDFLNRIKRSVDAATSAWRWRPPCRSTLWSRSPTDLGTQAEISVQTGPIPVYIIHFEQPKYLKNMIDQLKRLSVDDKEIVILDNASDDAESKTLLADLENNGLNVVRLERNFGPHEIFCPESGVRWPPVFALTDPDLQFDRLMPISFRQNLLQVALACRVRKAGCAISLIDCQSFSKAPYLCGMTIEQWERRYWREEKKDLPDQIAKPLNALGSKVYNAPIDTTFAVYVRDAHYDDFVQAVRVSGAFECLHLPWYQSGLGEEAKRRFSLADGLAACPQSIPEASARYFSTTKQLNRK